MKSLSSITVLLASFALVQATGGGYGGGGNGGGGNGGGGYGGGGGGYGGGNGGGNNGGGGGSPGGGGSYTDTCAEVNDMLSVPSPKSYRNTNVGKINACLCISGIPAFLSSNSVAAAGVSIAGKAAVTSALTKMISGCSGGPKKCTYPPHSVPQCQHGNPCSFTCKDGYTPYPPSRPTQCVCSKPNKVCNGHCGNYKACPSGYHKRELQGSSKHCPMGLSACGIIGRPQSWECVDTRTDLESCGGCIVPLNPLIPAPEGVDCTAIKGVSDVSCIAGECRVHRCNPGYTVNDLRNSCTYTKKDPALLAAQYGLEHVPMGSDN